MTGYGWFNDCTVTWFDKGQEDLIYGTAIALCLIYRSTKTGQTPRELWEENLSLLAQRG